MMDDVVLVLECGVLLFSQIYSLVLLLPIPFTLRVSYPRDAGGATEITLQCW